MQGSLLKQLTDLQRLDVAALRERWRALCGTEPPATYKRRYLVRHLAYRVQELAYGGPSDWARARLREIVEADEPAGPRPSET